jgi:hypothetical protein
MDGGNVANFMHTSKNMQYFLEKIHEITGMLISSMYHTFESYSGAFLHPSLGTHLKKGLQCI